MDFITKNLITILILVPILGALATLGYQIFLKQESLLKWVALGCTLVNFALSLILVFDRGAASASGFFFEENVPWIRAINTNYHVGVDGLSLWLVILTTFIMPIAVLSSWNAVEKRPAAFYIFITLRRRAYAHYKRRYRVITEKIQSDTP